MHLKVKKKDIFSAIDIMLKNDVITSINKGFSTILPFTILGSLFMLIGNFPLNSIKEFIVEFNLKTIIELPYILTFNIISIYLVFAIAFHYGNLLELNSISSGFIGLLSFLIVTPLFDNTKYIKISMEWLGAKGMFVAIIISIFSIKIYSFAIKKGWTIKIPDSVPIEVLQSFSSLIPIILVACIMLVCKFIFELTKFGNIHNFIYSLFQLPLQSLGNSLLAIIIFSCISNFLWWFGIHGSLLIKSITTPIFLPLAIQNLEAFQSGKSLPYIYTSSFNGVYNFGGAGMTLALTLLMLFFSKSTNYSTLGRLSIISNIFNINEPIIFGTPILLNPIMFVPFVVSPIICTIVPYFLTNVGILPKLISIQIPSTTPFIISGLIQGGWRVAVMQVVLLFLTMAIYFPFFKYLDNSALQKENNKK